MQSMDQGYWRGFGKLVWSKITFLKSTNVFLANKIDRRTIISTKVDVNHNIRTFYELFCKLILCNQFRALE